jgi:hypothetical protein
MKRQQGWMSCIHMRVWATCKQTRHPVIISGQPRQQVGERARRLRDANVFEDAHAGLQVVLVPAESLHPLDVHRVAAHHSHLVVCATVRGNHDVAKVLVHGLF